MLHAETLGFIHPDSEEFCEFHAQMPEKGEIYTFISLRTCISKLDQGRLSDVALESDQPIHKHLVHITRQGTVSKIAISRHYVFSISALGNAFWVNGRLFNVGAGGKAGAVGEDQARGEGPHRSDVGSVRQGLLQRRKQWVK